MTPTAPYDSISTVHSGEIDLAVHETAPRGPSIVLVHGYPDTHVLWDLVAAELRDTFHVIAYDVRGAGDSGVPSDVTGYHRKRLVDDLAAVLAATASTGRVHLVGHDWGSVQLWDAVVRERSDHRLAGRIASFTSISGPCIEHLRQWMRDSCRGSWQRRRAALGQVARSWYALAFRVPALPELALRHLDLPRALARSDGLGPGHFADSIGRDARHGVNLYRANLGRRQRVPGGPTTDVPVQLIVPLRDRYLSPAVYDDLASYAPGVRRVDLDAPHWAPRTHAREVAALVRTFAAEHPA